MIDLVDRIEFRYRAAFASPYWAPYPRVMVIAKLTRRNLTAYPKVRIVYQRREQMIVTVLPLKLDSNRRNKLKTLTV
ncbi:hypothetical protein IC232_21860 [Microvirga sp. BT688]|uniref:hypothetical protein n=1 Tax=Microvirga sp. TaxID=1873136 RepID=UPI001687A3E0|nr:hypothetical protein [Microvirga sp.]MBD2749329.1 hypothetical protein [Microvirga sp.]